MFYHKFHQELVPVVQLSEHRVGDGVPGSVYKELAALFQSWRDQRLKEDALEY